MPGAMYVCPGECKLTKVIILHTKGGVTAEWYVLGWAGERAVAVLGVSEGQAVPVVCGRMVEQWPEARSCGCGWVWQPLGALVCFIRYSKEYKSSSYHLQL